MLNLRKLWVGILGTVFFSVSVSAGAGPSDHNHSQHNHAAVFSAGEPGDPAKPARVVQVTMVETDGRMLFLPARIEITKGDQVKFVLRNNGKLDHEFVLASTAENLEHAKSMKENPDMAHDDPNGKQLAPSKTGQFVWKFSKAGEFEYACLIPGHREAGMAGAIVVK